jgi:NAD(P)-dependent dehydrogenase (short-subunit alcohol dehydrogenase family)
MDLRIKGRAALVTGASLGIGRATALELSAAGVKVAITARDPGRLREAADEISRSTGVPVTALPGDMAKADDIDRVFKEARSALGPIDILVNNAGSSPAGNIYEVTDEIWRASFELKLMGYVRCARAVLPEMCGRKWGRIVNVTGRGGEIPTASYLLGAFNAAATHFSLALSREAAPHGVMVNAVSPGGVNTPRIQSIVAQKAAASGRSEAEVKKEWDARIAIGHMAEPEDVADLIAFLCSDRARHIGGAVVSVDGGGTGGV